MDKERIYQINAAKFLDQYRLLSRRFKPNDKGLIPIKYKDKEALVEVRTGFDMTETFELWFNEVRNPKNPWIIQSESDSLLKNVAIGAKLLKEINRKWKDVPVEIDIRKFRPIRLNIPTSFIDRYYTEKKIFYINIGDKGFYRVGHGDPFDFNDVPKLKNQIKVKAEAKAVKNGNEVKFILVMRAYISSTAASVYNIAPTLDTDIRADMVNLNMFSGV